MISGDAAFPDVVDALTEHPAYFLGGHDHVSGVLTRADLNTAPHASTSSTESLPSKNTSANSSSRRHQSGNEHQ